MLGKQLEEMQAGKQELVVKYEEQLLHVKEEVRSAFLFKQWSLRVVARRALISNSLYDPSHCNIYLNINKICNIVNK